MMSRSIRHHLKVVRSVLVVRGHKQGHYTLKEGLGGSMVAKQCVPIDVVEVTVFLGRASRLDWCYVRDVKTEHPVKPAFYGISGTISVEKYKHVLLSLVTCAKGNEMTIPLFSPHPTLGSTL